MKITIKPKNLEVTPALQVYIEEKIGNLEKFIGILKDDNPESGKSTTAEVLVDVEKETEHHRKGPIYNCKLELVIPGKNLLSKSQGEDLRLAIVDARKELMQQIDWYKAKLVENDRREQMKTKEDIEI